MMGRHRGPGWMGGKMAPEAGALSRFSGHLPMTLFLRVIDVAGFADMFQHFIFTHSDSGTLFLGKKKITVDVAPFLPHSKAPFQLILFVELYW